MGSCGLLLCGVRVGTFAGGVLVSRSTKAPLAAEGFKYSTYARQVQLSIWRQRSYMLAAQAGSCRMDAAPRTYITFKKPMFSPCVHRSSFKETRPTATLPHKRQAGVGRGHDGGAA